MFPQLIIIFNSFIKYNFTYLAFIKMFYKFKIKELFNLLDIKDFKFDNFMKTSIFVIILK